VRIDHPQTVGPMSSLKRLEAASLQQLTQKLSDGVIVLDHENPTCLHTSLIPSRPAVTHHRGRYSRMATTTQSITAAPRQAPTVTILQGEAAAPVRWAPVARPRRSGLLASLGPARLTNLWLTGANMAVWLYVMALPVGLAA
jgi:hypothetical protein